MTSCNGGEFAKGRKLTLIHDECAGIEELFAASFGEVKSKRNRLGPGLRCIKALKCESLTGQLVGGKLSWWWQTVKVPSMAFSRGSPIWP